MTPQKIQDLADPIEAVYQKIADRLLVNIGRHLTRGTWTAYWEVEKLSELGQLTAENAAIINKAIKGIPQEVLGTMTETRRLALKGIEWRLNAAVEQGYIPAPVSDSTVELLRQYAEQVTEKLNLTNTTMLESSAQVYQQAVRDTSKMMAELNTGAAQIMTGADTRTNVLRRTIKRLADEGLTGFYDKAGRSWSPEAYVNMVMRTTVHNAAINSLKTRMQDYNTTVFQVSSHAGARPLCYPHQGKFYSWDNTSGELIDGSGRKIKYSPVSSTSYGQPAGLFGVNCRHYPIPVVPGATIPHGEGNVQPAAENRKEYAESQQQRQLERDIRAAKRVVAMSGDLATQGERDEIKAAQARMREFILQTGRARRYDREQI